MTYEERLAWVGSLRLTGAEEAEAFARARGFLPAPTSAWIEPCFSFRGKLYPGSLVVVNQHHALHLPNILMVTRVSDIYDAPAGCLL